MKVSVIMPVYNAAPFLEEAVHSALMQPECGEILLIEDGSVDDSLIICERLSLTSKKIKLMRHEDGKNHGAGASRNLGIVNAQFEWIAFLDADDYYLENRFVEQLKMIKQQYVDFIISPVIELQNGQSNVINIHKDLIIGLFLGGRNLGNTSSNFWKKSMLMEVGMFREDLGSCQEYDLMMRIFKANKLIGVADHNPVCVYRKHNLQRISNQNKIKLSITGLRHRLEIWQLFKNEILNHSDDYINDLFQVTIDISYFSRHLSENQAIIKFLMKDLFRKSFFKLKFKHKVKWVLYSTIGYMTTENIINILR